jgi:hypothetical protein
MQSRKSLNKSSTLCEMDLLALILQLFLSVLVALFFSHLLIILYSWRISYVGFFCNCLLLMFDLFYFILCISVWYRNMHNVATFCQLIVVSLLDSSRKSLFLILTPSHLHFNFTFNMFFLCLFFFIYIYIYIYFVITDPSGRAV